MANFQPVMHYVILPLSSWLGSFAMDPVYIHCKAVHVHFQPALDIL